MSDIDRLAALIREIDGNHYKGAGALAEELHARGVTVPEPAPEPEPLYDFEGAEYAEVEGPGPGLGRAIRSGVSGEDCWFIDSWASGRLGVEGEGERGYARLDEVEVLVRKWGYVATPATIARAAELGRARKPVEVTVDGISKATFDAFFAVSWVLFPRLALAAAITQYLREQAGEEA